MDRPTMCQTDKAALTIMGIGLMILTNFLIQDLIGMEQLHGAINFVAKQVPAAQHNPISRLPLTRQK